MNREQFLVVVLGVSLGWALMDCSRSHAQPYFREPDGGVTRWKQDAGWKSDPDRMKQYPKSEDNP